ncbi:hypothetical protein VTO42DRAFT_1918 [Malbranchea cinnamomea]
MSGNALRSFSTTASNLIKFGVPGLTSVVEQNSANGVNWEAQVVRVGEAIEQADPRVVQGDIQDFSVLAIPISFRRSLSRVLEQEGHTACARTRPMNKIYSSPVLGRKAGMIPVSNKLASRGLSVRSTKRNLKSERVGHRNR